jgi:hypothetical protein
MRMDFLGVALRMVKGFFPSQRARALASCQAANSRATGTPIVLLELAW